MLVKLLGSSKVLRLKLILLFLSLFRNLKRLCDFMNRLHPLISIRYYVFAFGFLNFLNLFI